MAAWQNNIIMRTERLISCCMVALTGTGLIKSGRDGETRKERIVEPTEGDVREGASDRAQSGA